ncbi:MAG: protein kinase [Ignavibacteriaceae bacterium]|nr:protein kinase [Ignavibacteriaceae bacterium]
MKQPSFKRGENFGKWQLQKYISAGGNGEVWKANSIEDSSQIVAIKLLKQIRYDGYSRFRDEVKIVSENSDILGLLQIIDQHLPKDPESDTPWYVMPIAKPLNKYLKNKTPEEIIDLILVVSNILLKLHGRGISHRDIKPANILIKDDVVCLSDFGLVEYPQKVDITPNWRDVGPRWTIAPEMQRNPDTSDGKLADVYSTAKTLWILLTKEPKGFEGQYLTGSSIELKNYVSSIYLSPIDEVIHRCTDPDPTIRQGIDQFITDLTKWKDLNRDYKLRSKSEWADIQKALFRTAVPKTVIWDKLPDIVTVLNIISEHKQVNHTMLPEGGGLDLDAANTSYEEGCIEINLDGFVHIIKPSKLRLECFPENSDWNYFRLDCQDLEEIGDYKHPIDEEHLTEIEPNVYSDSECYKFNDFNGEELPESARSVIRRITKGSFLICLKTGVYNSISGTYDGRHNKFDAYQFRDYIEKCISIYKSVAGRGSKTKKPSLLINKPKYVKSQKRRKGETVLNNYDIQLINKVIDLHNKVKHDDDKLEKATGFDGKHINLGERSALEMSQFLQSPRPHKEALRDFIDSLAENDLALIEAVMYGGRDALINGRAHPLDKMLSQFKSDSRDSRIFSIMDKAPLGQYLLKGMDEYK